MARFRDKPTGDQLVIMIAGTVCFSVIASGLGIAVLSILHPEKDLTAWVTRVTGILNTMVGLLAGFLAGRTDRSVAIRQQEELNRQPPGADTQESP